MQISSRFTVALHIFACVDTFKDEYKVTSDFLASSINTNPVIIRKILTQLKSAGLINVARGTGGIELTRALSEITFFDVYEAIEPVEDGDLFRFHEAPNPECPVGRNIHALLDDKLKSIQNAMETEMSNSTTQEERLDYLVEEFKADSGEYKDLNTPDNREEKRRILRSLMNIRMPKEISSEILKVQDEYLTERANEKGVVKLSDIPVIRDGLSIWQGDITRL